MTPEKICDKLKERFGEAIVATAADAAHPHATVALDKWREVAEFLHEDPELRFNLLRCVTALDLLEDNKLAVVFDLHAMHPQDGASGDDYWKLVSEFAVRVEMDRDDPHVASVADIWTTADWHEREAYDLMGIVFDGHPDSVLDHDGAHPRRILCPDDWLGHPLRKDYLYPMEYHGIPGTTEHELTSPRH